MRETLPNFFARAIQARPRVSPPRAMSGFVAELRDNAEAFVRRRKIDALCTDEDKVAPGTRPSEEIRAFVTTLPDLRFSNSALSPSRSRRSF
jgi:hypothetical protein